MSIPARLDRPVAGIVLILLSTVSSAGSDAQAKYLSRHLPAIEVLWLRYACFLVLVMAATAFTGPTDILRARKPGLQAARGLLVVISSILFLLGLRYLSISEATTTFYISPLIVTALSIVFLGEKVGPRRWLAVFVGLLGVLLVVRPGTDAFQSAGLLPIGSAIFWAGALIVTRMMSGFEHPNTTLFYTAAIGVLVLSALLPFGWVMPSMSDVLLGCGVGLAATIGQWLIIFAYRYADASVLAPFSYIQIIWATIIGLTVFREAPGGWSYIGAAIIIGSGLYTVHRERIRRRMHAKQQSTVA